MKAHWPEALLTLIKMQRFCEIPGYVDFFNLLPPYPLRSQGHNCKISFVSGSLFSGVLCVLLICRCRSLRKNRSRKRNLASDADGDYLVNGMYL